jgi:hypothetical protein
MQISLVVGEKKRWFEVVRGGARYLSVMFYLIHNIPTRPVTPMQSVMSDAGRRRAIEASGHGEFTGKSNELFDDFRAV